MTPTLAIVYPLPPDQAAALLASVGYPSFAFPSKPPDTPVGPLLGPPLTKLQGEIVRALTRKPPLNERQISVLEIYWQAHHQGEAALSIETVAARLAQKIELDPSKTADFVKGSLRSFGKRLSAVLSKVPVQAGRDAMGNGVADEIPLLAMISIVKGPGGEARHILTSEGSIAVAAALAMNGKGEAASTPSVDAEDPDEIVTLPMTRKAAALTIRVAKANDMTIDEAIKSMTARAGAG